MARWFYLLTAFTLLATWAGAQTSAPPSLSAEDKLRLLKTNHMLIGNLVDDGVAMSNTTDPVDRAARCRSAARSLVNAIQQAAAAEDAERVVVLTTLFKQVVTEGLVPTLNEAKQDVPPESPKGKQLQQVRGDAATDLTDLKAAISKLNASDRAQEAAKQLEGLGESLK